MGRQPRKLLPAIPCLCVDMQCHAVTLPERLVNLMRPMQAALYVWLSLQNLCDLYLSSQAAQLHGSVYVSSFVCENPCIGWGCT